MNTPRLLRIIRSAALVLLFAFMATGTALAQTTYYVDDEQGDDQAYNGQSATVQSATVGPFKTIERAITAASNGDNIAIEGGNYAVTADFDKNVTTWVYTDPDNATNNATITNIEVSDNASVTFGQTGGGSFLVPGAGEFRAISGSANVISGEVVLAANSTVVRTNGSISGSFTRQGLLNVTFNGNNGVSLTGSSWLPSDLQGGTLTVNFGSAGTLALSSIQVGGLGIGNTSTVTGDVFFTQSGNLNQIGGGNAGVLQNLTTLQNSVVTVNGPIRFTGTVAIPSGRISINSGDFGPQGSGAMIDVNAVNAATLGGNQPIEVNGGSFNTANNNFDLAYTVPDNTQNGVGGGAFTVGVEFDTNDLNNVTFNARNGTVNVTGAPAGEINGNVIVRNGEVPGVNGTQTQTVNFSNNAITIDGNLTVESNAILNVPANLTLNGSGNVVTGTVNGGGTLVLVGDGNDVVGLSGSGRVIDITVNNNESATVSGLAEIDGNVTTGTGSTLSLGLAGDGAVGAGNQVAGVGDITGSVTVNGSAFNLTSSLEIQGGDLIVGGPTAVNIGGNNVYFVQGGGAGLDVNDNGASFAGTGRFFFQNGSDQLDANGKTLPNVTISNSVNVGDNVTISGNFTQVNAGNTLNLGGGVRATLMGTATIEGGVIATGGTALLGNGVTITIDNDATVTTDFEVGANGVTLAETSADDDLTVTSMEIDGMLAMGTVDVQVGGLLDYDAGSITSGGGTLLLSAAGNNIDLAANLTIPRLNINVAGTIDVVDGVAGAPSLTVSEMLILTNGTLDIDNRVFILADNATLQRVNNAAQLTESNTNPNTGDVQLGANLTFIYGDNPANTNNAITTGDELANASSVSTIRVIAPVVLSSDVTVNTMLYLAQQLTENGNAFDEEVTLATGATLELDGANAGFANGSVSLVNPYNLTYDDYTGTGNAGAAGDDPIIPGGLPNTIGGIDYVAQTSQREFKSNLVQTLTVDYSGNDGIILAGTRTVGTAFVDAGTLDLRGNTMNVTNELEIDNNQSNTSLVSTSGTATVAFTGSTAGTIDLGTTFQPSDITFTLNKSDDALVVNLTGGTLDLDQNNEMFNFQSGLLNTDNNVAVILYEDINTQGFSAPGVTSTTNSYVIGNVRRTIPANLSAANQVRLFTFPVGDDAGNYRPADLIFAANTSLPASTTIEVDHQGTAPGGTVGLPLCSGVVDGGQCTGVTVGNYAPYYWEISSTQTLGPGQTFDLQLTGTEPFGVDFNDEEDLRIIRRFEGSDANPYRLQGQSYSNLIQVGSFDDDAIQDTVVTVRTQNTTGGLAPQGARFTIGLPARNPSITFVDAGGATQAVDPAERDTFNVMEGNTLNVTFTGDSQDIGESITFSLSGAPDFVTLTNVGATTATLRANPGFTDAGSYNFGLVVSDPSLSTTAMITLVVGDSLRGPTFVGTPLPNATNTVANDSTYTFTFAATDEDGDALTYSLANAVANAAIGAQSGVFTFSPDFNQVGQTFTFNVIATDPTGEDDTTSFAITVSSRLASGDISGDGTIDPADAQLAFQAFFNPSLLNAEQRAAADVDGDGTVGPNDAFLILRYAVSGTCYMSGTNVPAGCTAPAAKSEVVAGEMIWGQVSVENGIATLPIVLSDDVQGVHALSITLPLTEGVTAEALTTTLPEGWTARYATNDDGELLVGLFGLTAAPAGEIAKLQLRTTAENAPLLSGTSRLNGEAAKALDAVELVELPEEFTVQGNYPNPFNPSTTVSFDLPATAQVSIEVVDLLGRRVMVVPAQQFEAGTSRKVNLDASELASGTYLYRVIAKTAESTLVQTGKMTLVK